MTTAPPISALLRHQDFVRALAGHLVEDRVDADDLVQDTWVAALRSPPRAVASVRGWLARVMRNQLHNSRRSDARRRARELAAGERQSAESDTASQDRLELQHRVVEAVLALEQPYRTVVLLRFYEGLSSAEIARRQGVPGGTVRAQLSRGLDRLRARLDAEHSGGRREWCALLATLRAPVAADLGIVKLVAAGVVLGIALAVPIMSRGSDGGPPTIAAAATGAAPERDRGSRATAGDRAATTPTAAVAARHVIEPARTPDPDLAKKSLTELLDLALHVQALLRARLLEPEGADIERALARLQRIPGAGATRLLERQRFEFELNTPLGIRGGGSYFSFRNASHSYDDEPDVSLEGGQFTTGFYGGSTGFVLPIGDTALEALAEDAIPPTLAQDRRAQWEHMWSDAKTDHDDYDPAWQQAGQRLGLRDRAAAIAGRTYLVRAVIAGEHDVLVALRSVAGDADGHTIVWRTLHTFGTFSEPRRSEPDLPTGETPRWLERKTAAQLLDTLAGIREAAEPKLLEVPRAFERRYRAFIRRDDQGICRILPRGRFDPIVPARGGGAYYSFATESHEYESEPDVALQGNAYSSGFAGDDVGYLLDLGPAALDRVERMAETLDDGARRAYRFLFGIRSQRDETTGAYALQSADRQRARDLGLAHQAPAVDGHTYLLRSVLDRHDILVAFTTLRTGDDGHILLWRILARH